MSESGYHHADSAPPHGHEYLWPPILQILAREEPHRVFDLGCGNGAFVRELKRRGYSAFGVDPSTDGVARAKEADSETTVELGNAYEPLWERFGKFPAVVSQEVVGHVYYPRKFAAGVAALLEPGGLAVISTPYHGYWKNLMLALTGKLDRHFTALWDHGIIKFWSVRTLTALFAEVGLRREEIRRVGRLAPLAKSMIVTFRAMRP